MSAIICAGRRRYRAQNGGGTANFSSLTTRNRKRTIAQPLGKPWVQRKRAKNNKKIWNPIVSDSDEMFSDEENDSRNYSAPIFLGSEGENRAPKSLEGEDDNLEKVVAPVLPAKKMEQLLPIRRTTAVQPSKLVPYVLGYSSDENDSSDDEENDENCHNSSTEKRKLSEWSSYIDCDEIGSSIERDDEDVYIERKKDGSGSESKWLKEVNTSHEYQENDVSPTKPISHSSATRNPSQKHFSRPQKQISSSKDMEESMLDETEEESEEDYKSSQEVEEEESDFERDAILDRKHYDSFVDDSDVEETGAGKSEHDTTVGFTNAFLKRLAKKQTEILQEVAKVRTPVSINNYHRRSMSMKVRSRRRNVEKMCMSVEEEWFDTLSALPVGFFKSKEARLEKTSRITKGITAYQGVSISHKNNADMKSIFDLAWKSKHDLGQPMGTYEQFRIAVGQYARFAVAGGMIPARNMWKRGMLFKVLCSLEAVTAFIRYFEIRSAAGTVMNKANHLLRLARFACSYYGTKNESGKKGQMKMILEYLHTTARAFKTESRRLATLRREEDARISDGVFLTESDMEYFGNGVLDILNEIIDGCRDRHGEIVEKEVAHVFHERKKLVKKWSLNFLAVLMLYGGGQRPQVYTVLQVPTSLELMHMRDEANNSGVFSVGVSFEKRIRTVDFPKVIFPRKVFDVFNFHVNHVLPALYKTHDIGETDHLRKTLILNTQTGDALQTRQVTNTIRTVLTFFDPELHNMNSMTLRASFATVMLQKHRNGETLGELSEDEFIAYLAKIMNTSPEQLKETYIASDGKTFQACAAIIGGLLDSSGITSKRSGTCDNETQYRRRGQAPRIQRGY